MRYCLKYCVTYKQFLNEKIKVMIFKKRTVDIGLME